MEEEVGLGGVKLGWVEIVGGVDGMYPKAWFLKVFKIAERGFK